MKVKVELKVEILDGPEAGKIDIYTSIRKTETRYTEYGIIERLGLEWHHIQGVYSAAPVEESEGAE